ncbi:MAG: PRC-barrel domain-containing protein [Chloroflexota bacterium]|nr:PRC-barrel domain-containing protein [Chloroflexota bacterium]
MTIDLSSDNNQQHEGRGASAHITLVGLFEDVIDARHALTALRKERCPAETVSLIFRDRKADEGGPAQRHGAIAKAVEDADLNGLSSWLQGLASLIVPERGTYLVAGLLGAALAGVTLDDDDAGLPDTALGTILSDFGFGDDECDYLESRLQAGAMLVGVTTADQQIVTEARKLLADDNAVHIGAARTSKDVAGAATELLESPPEVYGVGDVVVTDAVAPLQTLVNGKDGIDWARSLKGTSVVDRDGDESGRIENLIAEPGVDDGEAIGHEHVRYVVVSFGGVLGIGRRFAAVPIEHVTLDGDPVQISIVRSVLQQAPAFDPDAPFSRREEQVVCAYFGCTPYWSEA